MISPAYFDHISYLLSISILKQPVVVIIWFLLSISTRPEAITKRLPLYIKIMQYVLQAVKLILVKFYQ
jgi:hypothetical protein